MVATASEPNATQLHALTVCIAAHNEAPIIGRAVSSVCNWAGHVIVLDCASSDATADVAQAAGAIVHTAPNMLPEANKNACISHATTEWVLILDADEVVPDALKKEIEETIRKSPTDNGFQIPRRNFYFGVPLMHGGNFPDMQTRLFRREKGRYPGVSLHETLIVDGSIGRLNGYFDHYTYPNFQVWYRKFEYFSRIHAELLAGQNMQITPRTIRRYMVVRPLRRWVERLFWKRGIKDGVPGILAATFDLMNQVVGFGRYWMMKRTDNEENRSGR